MKIPTSKLALNLKNSSSNFHVALVLLGGFLSLSILGSTLLVSEPAALVITLPLVLCLMLAFHTAGKTIASWGALQARIAYKLDQHLGGDEA